MLCPVVPGAGPEVPAQHGERRRSPRQRAGARRLAPPGTCSCASQIRG